MEDKENKIIGADGEEYIQRKIDIRTPIENKLKPGKRVKVYNKLRTNIHMTDCILGPEAEGDILLSDYKLPGISDKVIKLV